MTKSMTPMLPVEPQRVDADEAGHRKTRPKHALIEINRLFVRVLCT